MEFVVDKATRMLRRDKFPTTMVILQLPKIEENKKIFEVSLFMNSSIRIDRLRKPNKPSICYRCSQFFHTASNCNNPPRCGKCAGPHMSSDCTQKYWGDKAKCPNCLGNHVSSFSGCPKNPVNARKPKIPTQANRNPSSVPQVTRTPARTAPTFASVSAVNSKPENIEISRLEKLLVQMSSELKNVNAKISRLSAEVTQLKSARHG